MLVVEVYLSHRQVFAKFPTSVGLIRASGIHKIRIHVTYTQIIIDGVLRDMTECSKVISLYSTNT